MAQSEEVFFHVDIFNRIKKVIVNLLSASQSRNSVQLPEITLDTDFTEDLGLDSIELLDLITAVSEEFKVNTKEEMVNFKKVSDVVKYILKLKSKV